MRIARIAPPTGGDTNEHQTDDVVWSEDQSSSMADQSRQIKLASAKKKVRHLKNVSGAIIAWNSCDFLLLRVRVFGVSVYLDVDVFTEHGCCHYTSTDLCTVTSLTSYAPAVSFHSKADRCSLWACAESFNFHTEYLQSV